MNDNTGKYNGYIPDLGLFSYGETLEEVYDYAEAQIHTFFIYAKKHDLEYNASSTLEEITAKWKGYKVSLLTANIPD